MRILHLEDDLRDAELVEAALRGLGVAFEYARAATRGDFLRLLEAPAPNLILADYQLPGFNGLAALVLAREKCPEIPFIYVSGALGEETAIETLKQGATDYVLKDRLSRLVPAVQRALKEAAEHRDRQRAEEDLRRQTRQLRQSERQLRALAVHLQSVREEEATLLAREMHDELGQNLTGLKMDLAWLDRRLSAIPSSESRGDLQRRVALMSGSLDNMIEKVRTFCAQLRPGVLDELGLMSALDWQAAAFQARTDIACRLELPADEMRVDREPSTALFRIFQEILANIARHASAMEVWIKFGQEAGRWVLKVTDNGIGIPPEKINHPASIGLAGMRERALAVGGRVLISGAPAQGTTVCVEIPVSGAASGLAESGAVSLDHRGACPDARPPGTQD